MKCMCVCVSVFVVWLPSGRPSFVHIVRCGSSVDRKSKNTDVPGNPPWDQINPINYESIAVCPVHQQPTIPSSNRTPFSGGQGCFSLFSATLSALAAHSGTEHEREVRGVKKIHRHSSKMNVHIQRHSAQMDAIW